MLKKTVALLLSWKVLLFLFAFIATFILPLKPRFTPSSVFKGGFSYYLWIWGNFDGDHYLQIARTGYNKEDVPFFPLFPITIHALNFLHIPHLIAGMLVATICFVITIFLIYKILEIDKKSNLFLLIVLIMLLFPTSYSYGAVYNDSLFFMVATLTLYLGRKKQWFWASVVGFVATLARLNGLALFFYIITEYLIQYIHNPVDTFNHSKLLKAARKAIILPRLFISLIWSAVLIPLGYLIYLSWIQATYGDWRQIYVAMEGWKQNQPTFPLQVFWRYLKIIIYYRPHDIIYFVACLEIGMVLFYVAMMIYSWKRMRLSYLIFFFFSILIPAITGTFAGMPRYGLHLYPLFLSTALFLENKNMLVRAAYFLVSLLLLLFCVSLFTRGYFIA
jgi:Gpi18-like mannosyltransferase